MFSYLKGVIEIAYTSHLNDVLKVMKDNKREFSKKVGVLAVAEVQSIVTVDTGNLKRSIVSEVMPGNKGVYIGVTPNAEYGIFIEKGTSKITAQPYLEPGVTNAIPKIINVAEDLYSRLGRR